MDDTSETPLSRRESIIFETIQLLLIGFGGILVLTIIGVAFGFVEPKTFWSIGVVCLSFFCFWVGVTSAIQKLVEHIKQIGNEKKF